MLRLWEFPHSGRPGHFAGAWAVVISKLPYIVVYRVIEEEVQIVQVNGICGKISTDVKGSFHASFPTVRAWNSWPYPGCRY